MLYLWDQAVIFSFNMLSLDEGLMAAAKVVVSVSKQRRLLFYQVYLFWCKTVTTSRERTFSKSPHCD